jgi:hypothetical protein
MRALLACLVLLVACAKKAGEPAATRAVETGTAPSGEGAAATPDPAQAPPPPPAPTESVGGAPKGSAVDQARASGVLGPTDQHAFVVASSVTIKRASTKSLDTTAKTKLDAVKACYDKALEFSEKLAGELTLSIKAGKATVSKSTLANAELEKCVVEALAALPKTTNGTLLLAFARQDSK